MDSSKKRRQQVRIWVNLRHKITALKLTCIQSIYFDVYAIIPKDMQSYKNTAFFKSHT